MMIEREKVIKALENADITDGVIKMSDQFRDIVVELLKEQPEIVRCKDCKYYDHFNGCMSWHDVNSKNDNWYCADGERQEGR